jgi:hypothetical protein
MDMSLFSDRLMEDIRRLNSGQHSFLHQLCGPRYGRHRSAIEALVDGAAAPLSERARPMLTSLDNRRFFQAWAELATATALERGQLRVQGLAQPGMYLQAATVGGETVHVAVISFINKGRKGPDLATVRRLEAALDRVGSRQRLMVAVHGRLPHDFDVEEVRRAVDTWLGEVERGHWEGRYATFIDETRGIHLEFGLTGRTSRSGPRVCLSVGPFLAPASLAAAEPRILAELGRYSIGPHSGTPLLIACVSDQSWSITDGYMRDFLYGSPRSMEGYRDGERSDIELCFGGRPTPSLFRDPVYSDLSGVLWVGRRAEEPASVQIRAFLNPWARSRLEVDALPSCPVLGLHRWQDDQAVLRWHGERSEPTLSLF